MSFERVRVTDGPLNSSQQEYLAGIRRAAARHDQRLSEGQLSLPASAGQLVITISSRFNSSRVSPEKRAHLHGVWIEEAERLREERLRAGQYASVLIRHHAAVEEIFGALSDPEVAGMMFIGEGTISRFNTDSGGKDIGWHEMAAGAAFLKQGGIDQRMCGHYTRLRFVDIPFGTFAASRYSSVTAAVGKIVPDINPSEAMFQPVFTDAAPIYDQIIDLDAGQPRRVD